MQVLRGQGRLAPGLVEALLHRPSDIVQGVAGQVVVLINQRAADAAAQAGQAFQVVQVVDHVVLDLFQHANHIVDAVHRDAVARLHRGNFPAGRRPAHALGGKWRCLGLDLGVHQKGLQAAVDLHHGDGAVHLGGLMPDGAVDGRHLGRAGRNKEDPHVRWIHTLLFDRFTARHGCGHFHGLAQGDDIGNQRGKARLNQARDRRAGGGDERAGTVFIL